MQRTCKNGTVAARCQLDLCFIFSVEEDKSKKKKKQDCSLLVTAGFLILCWKSKYYKNTNLNVTIVNDMGPLLDYHLALLYFLVENLQV